MVQLFVNTNRFKINLQKIVKTNWQ